MRATTTLAVFAMLASFYSSVPVIAESNYEPITQIKPVYIQSDGTPGAEAVTSEQMTELRRLFAISIDPGVTEPNHGMIDRVRDPEFSSQSRSVTVASLQEKHAELTASLGDYVPTIRKIIFGHNVEELSRVELTTIGGLLVELSEADSAAASLVNDIYVNAPQIATNFAGYIREDIIRRRVEDDVRDGLKSDRYGVSTLVELKGPDSGAEMYARFYERLDDQVKRDDAEGMAKATKAIENDIRLRILRAVERTGKDYFQNLVYAASAEPVDTPLYNFVAQ